MKIYFDQIPEGVLPGDYPEGTEFVLDDAPMKRDPETFRLSRREKRPLVFPQDI